jgi:hypothetical protein
MPIPIGIVQWRRQDFASGGHGKPSIQPLTNDNEILGVSDLGKESTAI